MLIDVLGQRCDFGIESVFVAVSAAITVELDVGHVATLPFERLHRLEGRRPVPRQAEIIAVNVHRVRQPQFVDGLRDALNNLPRRNVERRERCHLLPLTLPDARLFQISTPPGLTSFAA